MAKDITVIIADSNIIKAETADGANTADRVGQNLVDIGEKLQAVETPMKFVKESNIILPETNPLLIATLDAGTIVAGTYLIGYSFEINFNGARNKEAHFRLDITDGSGTLTGTEFDIQTDNRSNFKNRTYFYPKVLPSGPYKLEFYMYKETGITEEFVLEWCDLMLDKKF